jgi:predicted nucleotidyltransferase component of viral defense system
MISKEYIQAWKSVAPWNSDAQVEQDLIISRALCELFTEPKIKNSLAFRGGTSLQKLFFQSPTRYSEDIDLVQIPTEGIGDVIDRIRKKLDPWLGKPQFVRNKGRATLKYRFNSTEQPVLKLKLKIEINNAEHFSVFGHQSKNFKMESDWFSGECDITTYTIEEIMGTKLRALYQRKKGRDLFDFAKVFEAFPNLSNEKVVQCFLKYMEYGGHRASRAEYEKALYEKREDQEFISDITPLLPVESESYNPVQAYTDVEKKLISLLPGEPWKRPTIKTV